jgi:iron complex transport system substrate-binding protein
VGVLAAATWFGSCTPPDADVGDRPDAGLPTRIVSLVPSVSSMIVALGEGHRLVGRTDYDHLPPLDTLPSVGGGLNPSLERLIALRPDLVIRFEGDTDTDTPERLDQVGIAHLAVRPDGVADVRDIVLRLGDMLDRRGLADSLVQALDRELEAVRRATEGRPGVAAAFVLGGNPPWVAGPGTFIDDLIALAGGRNVFADLSSQYGAVSPEIFRARGIEVILVGPGTTIMPGLTGTARVERLPASVELPGLDLGEAARAVASALHPGSLQ